MQALGRGGGAGRGRSGFSGAWTRAPRRSRPAHPTPPGFRPGAAVGMSTWLASARLPTQPEKNVLWSLVTWMAAASPGCQR